MKNDQEVPNDEKPKSRVVVFRCSDLVFEDILEYIRLTGKCFIVYTKTSSKKIMVKEEDWPY